MVTGLVAADAKRARKLHRHSIVVDTVNRSVIDDDFIRDIRGGGATILGRTILVSSGDVFSPFGFPETLRDIVHTLQAIKANPDDLLLVKTPQDIDVAMAEQKTGLYIYFQSPEPLGTEPWRLDLFTQLGLRVLQMTYNARTLTGDGCAEPSDAGLSDYGRWLIDACNERGIALDVSHCGDRTTLETIEHSRKPVLITHGNARALCENPRCKTDEAAMRCAESGGVVGVVALPAFLSTDPDPTLENMLRHLDYWVQLIGVDHVGLGLDLTTGHEQDDFSLLGYKPQMYQNVWKDGVQQAVPGIRSLADLPNITEGLVARGYSDEDIRKVLGGNFVRVFRSVWPTESSP